MASTTTTPYAARHTNQLLRTRAVGVVGAVIAAVAVWLIEVPILGLHLDIRFGTGAAQTIGIGLVIGATLFASLLGWGVLALLEHRTSRGRSIWTALAVAVLLASLSLPVSAGITASTKVALAAMHIVVGALLIPSLRSASPSKERA